MSRPISADELSAILEQAPEILGLSRSDLVLDPVHVPVDQQGRANGESSLELAGCSCWDARTNRADLPSAVRLTRRGLRIVSEDVDLFLGACRDCGRVYWG